MARYVDVENMIFDLSGLAYIAPTDFSGTAKYFADQIKNRPTADVRENVRGEWIEPKPDGCWHFDAKAYAECSVCGKKQFLGYRMHFCPDCGSYNGGKKDVDE